MADFVNVGHDNCVISQCIITIFSRATKTWIHVSILIVFLRGTSRHMINWTPMFLIPLITDCATCFLSLILQGSGSQVTICHTFIILFISVSSCQNRHTVQISNHHPNQANTIQGSDLEGKPC